MYVMPSCGAQLLRGMRGGVLDLPTSCNQSNLELQSIESVLGRLASIYCTQVRGGNLYACQSIAFSIMS